MTKYAKTGTPEAMQAVFRLALSHHQAGRFAEAEQAYREALAHQPDNAIILGNLGIIACQVNRPLASLDYFSKSLQSNPGNHDTYVNLGNALKMLGRDEEAAASFSNALSLKPDHVMAHFNLANTLHGMGRHATAVEHYRTALKLKPDYAVAFNNLGNTLQDMGDPEAAVECYRRVLALKPGDAVAHNNLGNAYAKTGQIEAALQCYLDAIRLDPQYAEAHNNLGGALQESGQYSAAIASFGNAAALDPNFAKAHNNLGAMSELGQFDLALASYRRALEIDPNFHEAHSNLLFTLNYMAERPPEEMLLEARAYGERVQSRARPFTFWNGTNDPQRKLRVGFVSGDLRTHPVGFFLESVLASLAPERIELLAYVTNGKEDDLTRRLLPFFAGWRNIAGLDDASAARLIHDDAVDILIDLAGHTADNRLPVFAWKPAPVQVAWLGYFATTGVPGIDYLLADRHVCPPGEESHFSETVWRLPDAYYCFTPPPFDLAPSQPPCLEHGQVVFGCFNRLAKMNETVVATWSSILRAVPGAKLFLKARELDSSELRQSVADRFAAHGIAPERLIYESRSPRRDYLAAYQRVDIALDPFPYTGGATTADALWMGVPVLTLRGDRFIGHQGETLLRNVGLDDWIAADRQDYIAKAAAFAAGTTQLAALRDTLRARLLASPLCDAARFSGNLETALTDIWHRWCEGQTSV